MPGHGYLARASLTLISILLLAFTQTARAGTEILPSWKVGTVRQSILDFVKEVTDESGPNYVKPSERIAVFDNDGTLCCEQPVYIQIRFATDRAQEEAVKHPEYREREPFRGPVAGDTDKLVAGGARGSMELIAAEHAGISINEFAGIVENWLEKSKHPRFEKPYNQCLYQPMIEVLDYLRQNQFKTYIVSGGGLEFMRPWTEKAYGIPPEQVIGSNVKIRFENQDGHPEIYRTDAVEFVDDGDQKPVAIEKIIGRRPIAAFGNSDGDKAMLEWTMAGKGKRLAVLIHHTDNEREYCYDRESKIGHLDKALDEARAKGWTVVDMKSDWRQVFAFDRNNEALSADH